MHVDRTGESPPHRPHAGQAAVGLTAKPAAAGATTGIEAVAMGGCHRAGDPPNLAPLQPGKQALGPAFHRLEVPMPHVSSSASPADTVGLCYLQFRQLRK